MDDLTLWMTFFVFVQRLTSLCVRNSYDPEAVQGNALKLTCPETGWLEDDVFFWDGHRFRGGTVSFRECKMQSYMINPWKTQQFQHFSVVKMFLFTEI